MNPKKQKNDNACNAMFDEVGPEKVVLPDSDGSMTKETRGTKEGRPSPAPAPAPEPINDKTIATAVIPDAYYNSNATANEQGEALPSLSRTAASSVPCPSPSPPCGATDDNLESHPSISPLPLRRSFNAEPELLLAPGAYAGVPGQRVQRNDIGNFGSMVGLGMGLTPSEEFRLDEGLAIAQPVSEEQPFQSLFASQEKERHKPQEPSCWGSRGKIFVSFLAVAALVTAVLLPLVKHHQNGLRSSRTDAPSLAPTLAPTLSLPDYIQSLFPEETQEQIQLEGSPQFMAFQWTLEDPLLETYPDWRIIQRFALVTFYHASKGSKWRSNSGWLSHSQHECQWFTASSFGNADFYASNRVYSEFYLYPYTTSTFPCSNNQTGRYQHLWLDLNNLEADHFPHELYLLSDLKSFSVALNKISSTFPERIGSLTNLEAIALGLNSVRGTIPTELSSISTLKAIVLGTNRLEGTIPNLQKLSNLEFFVLRDNLFTGTIPSTLGSLSNLLWLWLDNNALTGTLPRQLGQLHERNIMLTFGNNQLHGTIPTELGLLTKMTWLAAQNSYLTGTLPSELGLMTDMKRFLFNGNWLSGSIPSELGNQQKVSITWSLAGNGLTGTIPTELGLLTNCRDLLLHENQLSGLLPSEIGQSTGLRVLQVQGNPISGSLPEEVAQLEKLGLLYNLNISGTFISGELPNSVCNIMANCPSEALYEAVPCYGLDFECSEMLCGCSCPCRDSNNAYNFSQ